MQSAAATTGLGVREGHRAEQLVVVIDLDRLWEFDSCGEGSSVAQGTIHGHIKRGVCWVGDLDAVEAHGRVVKNDLGDLGQDHKECEGYADCKCDDGHDGAEDPVLATLIEWLSLGLRYFIVLVKLMVVFVALVVWKVLNPV